MDKNEKIALGVGVALLAGVVIVVVVESGKKPSGGPASFTVRVINLPAEADRWSLAFQDPSTGTWYQRANLPFPPPPGSSLLLPEDVAPMRVPVSSGISLSRPPRGAEVARMPGSSYR